MPSFVRFITEEAFIGNINPGSAIFSQAVTHHIVTAAGVSQI